MMARDFTVDDWNQWIWEIARLNALSGEEAGEIAQRIGDTPELDEQNRAILRTPEGHIAQRIILPDEDDER